MISESHKDEQEAAGPRKHEVSVGAVVTVVVTSKVDVS
jgi:hypothetical protein